MSEMNSPKGNYKPVWYVLSLIGIVFIIITIVGFNSFTTLESVLSFGNNASNQNITDVDYIHANYFVGDGSLLTNLSVNTTQLNDTLQSVTDRGASTTNAITVNNDLTVNGNVEVSGNVEVESLSENVIYIPASDFAYARGHAEFETFGGGSTRGLATWTLGRDETPYNLLSGIVVTRSLPKGWDSYSVEIYWAHDSEVYDEDTSIVFDIRSRSYSIGSNTDIGFSGGTYTESNFPDTYDFHSTQIPFLMDNGVFENDDIFALRIGRRQPNEEDTFDDKINIIGVKLTKNNQ